ncbi:MAG: hypothetical protein ACOYMF_18075, partial [Bacteroidales bacterium]
QLMIFALAAITPAGKLELNGYNNDVKIKDKYLFVAKGSAGLVIYNCNNSEHKPVQIAQISSLANLTKLYLDPADNYLYCIGGSSISDFQVYIVDISNPAIPVVKSSFRIPWKRDSNQNCEIKDIVVKQNYAYIFYNYFQGYVSAQENEFSLDVFNISNKYSPTLVKTVQTIGWNVSAMLVDNSIYTIERRYYADGIPWSYQGWNGIARYSISDPTNPALVESLGIGDYPIDFFMMDTTFYITTGQILPYSEASANTIKLVGLQSLNKYQEISLANIPLYINGDDNNLFFTNNNTEFSVYSASNPPVIKDYRKFQYETGNFVIDYPYVYLCNGYNLTTFRLTSPITLPLVSTSQLSQITTTSADCGGNVISNGGSSLTARGVCYGRFINPTILDTKTNQGIEVGTFSGNITGLSPGTSYNIRAYATNIVGTTYGKNLKFVTLSNLVVTTNTATSITQSSAVSGGTINGDAGSPIIAKGVCWSNHASPKISDSYSNQGSGNGSFSSNITGLIQGTKYYVRAYVSTSLETIYGSEVSFTTLALPTLSTISVSSLTTKSVTVLSFIESDGGSQIISRGVCWSSSHNPTILNLKTTDGSGSGGYSSSIAGLDAGTTYYLRSFASNSVGTSYGNEISFTTHNLPGVTTDPVTAITGSTATCGGNITSSGGEEIITARGVCWGTTSNPTLNDSSTSNGTGFGTFTSNLQGLSSGTTYYVRAYSVTVDGITYGATITFSTVAFPVVETKLASNITASSASSGGMVYSDGGTSITACGVCWNISGNPTITDNKTVNSPESGVYTSNMIPLLPGTFYYVKAYVTNSVGTSYGSQISFKTADATHFSPVWWPGNGMDQMNLYALTAKLDGADLQPGDEIGIFDGNVCVGMGVLTQVLTGSNYLECMVSGNDPDTPLKDGFTTGNAITYKVWDSSASSEVSNVQANYVSGVGIYEPGATSAVDLTALTTITQDISLSAGWNIMSFAAQPSDMSLKSIVTPLITAGTLTKIQNEKGNAIEKLPAPIGWVDNIGQMKASEGYKVKVTGNTTLSVTGLPVTLPYTITLDAGWNIIGYPSMTSQAALTTFDPLITAATLLKVQDEAGNAIEKLPAPIGWIDNIHNLSQGNGYKVKTSINTSLTINNT